MDSITRYLAPHTPAATVAWVETVVRPGCIHFRIQHSDGTILDGYRFDPPAMENKETPTPR